MERTVVDMKKLFATVCLLKVLSASLGFWFSSVWVLGTIVPLTLMLGYIFIGIRYRGTNLSEAKFADSCYYLGFIFTVFSIIVCLFDINSIGTDLMPIAIRFGAAMLSTVLGIGVRVWLVSFRQNTEDAVRNVEDQIVDASRKLADEFEQSFNQLLLFRAQVVTAAVETVASVKTEIQSLIEHNTAKLDEYFEATTKRNNDAFLAISQDVKTASLGLSNAVNSYTDRAGSSMKKMEDSVVHFGDKAMQRLEEVKFPDDLFTARLDPSVTTLRDTTEDVNEGVRALSAEVRTSARQVATSIRGINSKTETLGQSLDIAQKLMDQQVQVLDAMHAQNQLVISRVSDQQESFSTRLDQQQQAILKIVSGFDTLENVFHRVSDVMASNNSQSEALKRLVEETRQSSNDVIEALQNSLQPLVHSVTATAMENAELRSRLESAQEASLGFGHASEKNVDTRQGSLLFMSPAGQDDEESVSSESRVES